MNILCETNYINLWPFTFFSWLLSVILCPIQYFNESLGLLHFSPTVADSGVNIDRYLLNCKHLRFIVLAHSVIDVDNNDQ